MMKHMTFPAAVAAVALAVAGCGSSTTTATSSASSGNGVDRAFVAEMIPHHQSAVAMAKIAQQRATTPFVKTLSSDILRTQSQEITRMRTADAALGKAGIAKGELGVAQATMGMSTSTASLQTATPFDPAFLTMMLPHHAGAVTMAKAELTKGQNSDLKQLAGQIIAAQTREIGQMRAAQAEG